MYIYIYIYIRMYMYMYTYIYIYMYYICMERERERERSLYILVYIPSVESARIHRVMLSLSSDMIVCYRDILLSSYVIARCDYHRYIDIIVCYRDMLAYSSCYAIVVFTCYDMYSRRHTRHAYAARCTVYLLLLS